MHRLSIKYVCWFKLISVKGFKSYTYNRVMQVGGFNAAWKALHMSSCHSSVTGGHVKGLKVIFLHCNEASNLSDLLTQDYISGLPTLR